ncbi:hypothetical protein LCGC14_1409150 [marine sediment metagenome]|uniref:Uncharacterized protein n=1 Tax=marine sediment metagenome TaxID=412755 RepID=A0A0F9JUT2_9ZZZZ
MDTSEQYIKMCEKAEEIQKPAEGWLGGSHISGNIYFSVGSAYTKEQKIPDGYYYFLDETFEGEECDKCGHKEGDRHKTIKSIWLPRQDQLQEMVSIERGNIFTGLVALRLFIESNAQYEMTDWSMEQLWLAFVMKSLYQKSWDGTEWVKG